MAEVRPPAFGNESERLAQPLISGDDTWQETLVPIPNTTVKLPGPMIVPTSAKVGYRRNLIQNSPHSAIRGVGAVFLR